MPCGSGDKTKTRARMCCFGTREDDNDDIVPNCEGDMEEEEETSCDESDLPQDQPSCGTDPDS